LVITSENSLAWGRGNDALTESCRSLAEEDGLHDETASMVIIEALWERLRQTHGFTTSIVKRHSALSGQRPKLLPGRPNGVSGRMLKPYRLGTIGGQRGQNRQIRRQSNLWDLDQVVIALGTVTTALISRLRGRPRNVMTVADR